MNDESRDERRGRERGHRDGHRTGRRGPGGPGGPGGPRGRGRGRRRGDIRRLLLAGLLDGPAHGYELMRRLEERSDGRWRPSPGSVYPMLQQLEDEGLVRSGEDQGRKVYEVTDEGREQADPAALDELGHDGEDDPSQGLRAEMEQLHMAVRQVRAVGGDAQVAEVAGVLRQARQTVYRLLAES